MFPDPDVWRWGRDDSEPPDDPYRYLGEDEDGDPDLWEDDEELVVEGEPKNEMDWLISYIALVHHRL